MNYKIIIVAILGIVLSSCLKTRSQVSEVEQSMIYRKKLADNQNKQAMASGSSSAPTVNVNSIEEEQSIRELHGQVEVLQNELSRMKQEKEMQSAELQKMNTLQEALLKMEAELAQLRAEKEAAANRPKASDENLKATDKLVAAAAKKENTSKVDPNKAKTDTAKGATAVTKGDSATAGAVGTKATDTKKTSYDLAEEYFQQKDWKKAIISYQKFIEEFPKSKNVPEAKYKTGVCFQELGLKDEALAFYEEVSLQHPNTMAGKKAKTRISKLKKK